MTPEEKKEVKLEIESRIKEAEENLVTLREQTAPIPPSVALGRLTRMDQIQQKSMAEANVKTNENLVKNLNKALANLDNDDFGVCAICKKEIPLGRILIVPETKVCVQCASGKRR